AGDNLYLWEVSSGENKCYLLGGLHVCTDDFYPLPKPIEDAYTKSKVFVIEADIDGADTAKLGKWALEKGAYPKGEKLTGHVSKETADRLRAYCQQSKIPVETFESMKPWMVFPLITITEVNRAGYTADKGLDKYFAKKAKKDGKPVNELETL